MNKSPPIQESSYYIHQRYEDTSQVIFQQQQKKKKELSHVKHRHPDSGTSEVEFTHYGNPGVIARKEAAARLASYKEGKSPRKKEDKSSKEEKSLKKEEKSSKKEEKSSKKEEKSSKRKDSDSEKGAHGGRDHVFPEKYTPIESPSLLYVNRSRVLSPRSLPKETSLDFEKYDRSESPDRTDLLQYSFPYSPTSTEVTSPSQTFSDSPQETSFGTGEEKQTFSYSSRETSFGTEKESISPSPRRKEILTNSPVETSFGTEEDSVVESPNKTGFSQYTFPYHPNDIDVTSPSQTFSSSPRDTFFRPEEDSISQTPKETPTLSNRPRETTFGTEEGSIVESPNKSGFSQFTFPYCPNDTEITPPSQTLSNSPRETSFGPDKTSFQEQLKEARFNSKQKDIPHSPNGKPLDSDRDSSPDLEREDSFVEFGHYGNTGVYAKREAVARVASILRKDGKATKSTVCSLM